MFRSFVAVFIGVALALLLSTIGLGLLWGGPEAGDRSLTGSLLMGLLVLFLAGTATGIVAERRTLLHGAAVGLLIGTLVGVWEGPFPLKYVFFQVPLWRILAVPMTTIMGALGGALSGRLVAPGGLLAKDLAEDQPWR